MGPQMYFRMATTGDAGDLAYIHDVCSKDQPGSFMFRLGRRFLKRYYRLFVNEKKAVILLGVNEQGATVGFVSGTLDAAESVENLRKHKISLFLAALGAAVFRPRLLAGLFSRYWSISRRADREEYMIASGARCTCWAVLPEARPNMGAVTLLRTWLALMRVLEAGRIRMEVDVDNTRSEMVHKLLGGRLVHKYHTPDGKPRVLMEYPDPKADQGPDSDLDRDGTAK
jgi:hypothetical protein